VTRPPSLDDIALTSPEQEWLNPGALGQARKLHVLAAGTHSRQLEKKVLISIQPQDCDSNKVGFLHGGSQAPAQEAAVPADERADEIKSGRHSLPYTTSEPVCKVTITVVFAGPCAECSSCAHARLEPAELGR
jgi:hypothetical protein